MISRQTCLLSPSPPPSQSPDSSWRGAEEEFWGWEWVWATRPKRGSLAGFKGTAPTQIQPYPSSSCGLTAVRREEGLEVVRGQGFCTIIYRNGMEWFV